MKKLTKGVVGETQGVLQRPTQMAENGVLDHLCAVANFLRQQFHWLGPAGRRAKLRLPPAPSPSVNEAGMERTHVLSRDGHWD